MDLSGLMEAQRDVVRALGCPLFVSAGAGSGKTFTLTRRILWALSEQSGPYLDSLDQVLAITFTRDAAQEIRERVRAALIEEGMDAVALTVDDAWISTIHGMCARMLRTHALELGLDPEFSMLENTDELMDTAVEHVIARAEIAAAEAAADSDGGAGHTDDSGASLTDLLAWYPLRAEPAPGGRESGTSVRHLVRRLLELASALPDGMDGVRLARGYTDTASLADAYRPMIQATPTQVGIAERALDALERFERSPQRPADLARCMMACDAPSHASKKFDASGIAYLKAELAETFVNAWLRCGRSTLDALIGLARDVEAEYRSLKDARSLLDNNDLLRLAWQALRDNEGFRAAYEGRFRLVMIDEFQDTDRLQVDLIGYLAGEGSRALCTVGDAQQSIYRFRGAEVEVFCRQEREMRLCSEQTGAPSARFVQLVRSFRSHSDILAFVKRVFDGRGGGLMSGFLDLEAHEGRRDLLVPEGVTRCRALLVAGGDARSRAEARAAAIAERFRRLAEGGQPAGDMVILLGKMKWADTYACALRVAGLDAVISGGSVFAETVEARSIRALACALANPADGAEGLVPTLISPMFALGAQELLALSTAFDPETGETRRRGVEVGLMSDEDAPGLGGLPLVERARDVMRRALDRVGRDPFDRIALDVVNESGWMVRLASRGPQGRAIAANVLKALDAISKAQDRVGNAPRLITEQLDRFLASKQAPGALNVRAGDAVRIMTVHASKGLEFPVVAVADCFGIRQDAARLQTRRSGDAVEAVVVPAHFPSVLAHDGSTVEASKVKGRFNKFLNTKNRWLDLAATETVSATGSAARAFIDMSEEERTRSLEERARLLYVAMTRAQELLILALDASVRPRATELDIDSTRDLTSRVLERILPEQAARLDADRLALDGSAPGDFELISLADFTYGNERYEAPDTTGAAVPGESDAGAGESAGDPAAPDVFTLVYPHAPSVRIEPAIEPCDSYSYTSMAASLHEIGEDRIFDQGFEPGGDPAHPGDGRPERLLRGRPDDPTALGSAFHAAAQWLIEQRVGTVPVARLDALSRCWRLSDVQRERLVAALLRWERSDVRAELLGWPIVRAEVAFFSPGMDAARERFGTYAEGAIDALATDPDLPDRAYVIDYKTGGSADESPASLQSKHELQARIYADVLRRAGRSSVTLKFVRVEIDDPTRAGQPQIVTYRFG